MRRSFWLAIVAFILSSCRIPDQTSILPHHKKIADPSPELSAEKIQSNNNKHKVLVGVFDGGVDYNHPYLKNHMHYELDAEGKPKGLGLDFAANDTWASHRVIDTEKYFFDDLSEKQKKDALDRYKSPELWNKEVIRKKGALLCGAEVMNEMDPRLSKYFHPYRMDGRSQAHGTHVAGLVTYDNPEIGVIPYRVIPYHQTDEEEKDEALGKADKFVKNFENAVVHAEKQGVRVINLSLGGSITKPTDASSASYEEEMERYENYRRIIRDEMTRIVKKHPKMLFVAAAGNDSGWSDNESRIQYPCGVESSNVLCVGALNEDGSLANFTNWPLNQDVFVLTSGVEVRSTVPSDQCTYADNVYSNILTSGTNRSGLCRYDLKEKKWVKDQKFMDEHRPLVNTMFDACAKRTNLFDKMSGTSMATPIVSHLAAEELLKSPNSSPEEVIGALKKKAIEKRHKAFVLSAPKPSWYKLYDDNSETFQPRRAETTHLP